jgi:hypothetical protein
VLRDTLAGVGLAELAELAEVLAARDAASLSG